MTAATAFHPFDRFTDIDRHFANFVLRLEGRDNAHLWLAAALVSNATQAGNVCLDLAALAGKPLLEGEVTASTPCAPGLFDWLKALKQSTIVGEPGEFRPLVLDYSNRLYLYRYWKYEQRVAEFLAAFASTDLLDCDADLLEEGLSRLFPPGASEELDWQRLAAVTAMLRRFSLITGGPGTGKTSTVLRILALLVAQSGPKRLRIALSAPTGKAAARLKEAVKQSKATLDLGAEGLARIPEDAFTLHRLLGFMPGSNAFRHNRTNPLPFEMIVVDEASMVDLSLMAKLLDAISPDARLLFLGDRDQLASVEPGAVFGDICTAAETAGWSKPFRERVSPYVGKLPTLPIESSGPLRDSITVLRRSYRFGSESGIGQLSRGIRAGDNDVVFQLLKTNNLPDVGWEELAAAAMQSRLERWILEAYSDCLEAGSPAEALMFFARNRILCAVRQGQLGVTACNQITEDTLTRKGLVRPRGAWYRGRPVIINHNDYQLRLFNGDIGIAWETPPEREKSGEAALGVFFPSESGELRRILPSRLPEHETVFAMTVHKAQGSEFDRVLLILPDQVSPVLTREMLYTAVTRARKRVEIWARKEILEVTIGKRVDRHSGLHQALS